MSQDPVILLTNRRNPGCKSSCLRYRRHGIKWVSTLPSGEAVFVLAHRLQHVTDACWAYKVAITAAYQDHTVYESSDKTIEYPERDGSGSKR